MNRLFLYFYCYNAYFLMGGVVITLGLLALWAIINPNGHGTIKDASLIIIPAIIGSIICIVFSKDYSGITNAQKSNGESA